MVKSQGDEEVLAATETLRNVQSSNTPPSSLPNAQSQTGILLDERSQSLKMSASTESSHSDKDTRSRELSFVSSLQQYQADLNQGFDQYDQELNQATSTQGEIADFDWEDLENSYQKQIATVALREKEIISQFEARFKQFMLWMQVSDERENQRAIKRIKTQSAYVQNSENELAQKEQHYTNVMEAFQNAMQLLSRPA